MYRSSRGRNEPSTLCGLNVRLFVCYISFLFILINSFTNTAALGLSARKDGRSLRSPRSRHAHFSRRRSRVNDNDDHPLLTSDVSGDSDIGSSLPKYKLYLAEFRRPRHESRIHELRSIAKRTPGSRKRPKLPLSSSVSRRFASAHLPPKCPPESKTLRYLYDGFNFDGSPTSRPKIKKRKHQRSWVHTAAGAKWDYDNEANQDIGRIEEYIISWDAPRQVSKRPSKKSSSLRKSKNFHHQIKVEMVSVFDGHGRQDVGKEHEPGQTMSRRSLKVNSKLIFADLLEMLSLPIVELEDPRLLEDSRQSVFANTLEETDELLKNSLPPAMTSLSGTTATIVLSIQSNYESCSTRHGDFKPPVLLMTMNLGDSRATVYTLKARQASSSDTSSHSASHSSSHELSSSSSSSSSRLNLPSLQKYERHSSEQLTEEENIRERKQQRVVLGKLQRLGHRLALPSFLQGRRSPSLIFLPPELQKLELTDSITSLWDLTSPSRDLEFILQAAGGQDLRAFSVELPYLVAFSTEGVQDNGALYRVSGLQLTGSIGDSLLEPIKKSSQSPTNVHTVPLLYQQGSISVLVVASDGLWEAEEQHRSRHYLSDYIADWLSHFDVKRTRSCTLAEMLAKDLVKFARKDSDDDITVAVTIYKEMAISKRSQGSIF